MQTTKECGDTYIDKVEHYTCDKLFLNAGSTGTSELLLKSQA